MERTLNVKGMMCVNCQKHVHDALLAMDGVSPWMNLDPSSAKPVTNWLDQADLQTAAQAVAVFSI